MKGQKVYTVTEESAVEGMHDIDVHVYENREDALERWKFVVGLWKDGMDDWQQAQEKEGDFEAWQDGYYDENHVTVYLDEKEVE